MTLAQVLFSFDGRLSRRGYWFAFAISVAVQIAAEIVDVALFGSRASLASLVAGLVLFYASLAVSAKRWHDRDKSGWWVLICLLPVVGWVWLVVENGFLRGVHGPNRYGPDPVPLGGAALPFA